jgi:PPK2 family polyphosphate:nucleotide phosphotransferase
MIKLSDISTRAPKEIEKDAVKDLTKDLWEKIGEKQALLYAQHKHAVLLVLQGMDGSGKDGTTRGLFSKSSPQGVWVKGFKKPTEEEFAHDFLWRIHQQAPQKGFINVFVRSHYEDILIQYVHGWIDAAKRDRRMKSINAFEELLVQDNNTTVLKFFLHISPEEQLEKLQERVDNPKKQWKHNDGDWEERKLWAQYQEAYEYAINNSNIPWHIIPADQEWYRDYVAAKIFFEALEALPLSYPPLVSERFPKV